MQLKGNRMLILRNDEESKTLSGIYIPETAKKKRNSGKVVSIGDTVEGEFLNKNVLFDPIAGEKFLYNDIEHVLLFKSDIRAII